MSRISAWISLEPDAGTRKNNIYPDDRHPAAVSNSPPQPSEKYVAAVATPAIAEEVSSEATDSDHTALETAAVTDTAAADTVAAAATPATTGVTTPKMPETSQAKTENCHPSGDTGVRGTDVHERDEGRPGAEAEVGRGGAGGDGPPSPFDTTSTTLNSTLPLPPHLPTVNKAPSTAAVCPRPTDTVKAADSAAADDDDHHHHQGLVLPARTTTPNPPPIIGGVVRLLPNALSLTPVEKAKAARECKRLLDAGRRTFIEEQLGLTSEIVHFVGRDISPENAVLLGFRGD